MNEVLRVGIACKECYRWKMRCDKGWPCAQCLKMNVPCTEDYESFGISNRGPIQDEFVGDLSQHRSLLRGDSLQRAELQQRGLRDCRGSGMLGYQIPGFAVTQRQMAQPMSGLPFEQNFYDDSVPLYRGAEFAARNVKNDEKSYWVQEVAYDWAGSGEEMPMPPAISARPANLLSPGDTHSVLPESRGCEPSMTSPDLQATQSRSLGIEREKCYEHERRYRTPKGLNYHQQYSPCCALDMQLKENCEPWYEETEARSSDAASSRGDRAKAQELLDQVPDENIERPPTGTAVGFEHTSAILGKC